MEKETVFNNSLSNLNSELESYCAIAEKNLVANMHLANEVEEQLKNTPDTKQVEKAKELAGLSTSVESEYPKELLDDISELNKKIEEMKETIKANVKEVAGLAKEISSLNMSYDKAVSNHNELSTAYKTAINYYKDNFDMNVQIVEMYGNIFKATVTFGDEEHTPDSSIKVTINKDTNTIMEFDSSSICHPKQEQALQQKFAETKDNINLLYTLHEIWLKKYSNINVGAVTSNGM